MESLLALRVAGIAYAIRMRQISGLAKDRRVVPVPSRIPELLGVTGIRGALVSVYDLASLLGHPRPADQGRWLVFQGKATVGFAFEQFERYVEVPRAALTPPTTKAREGVRELAPTDDVVRVVIDLDTLLDEIERRIRSLAASKEG